MAPIRFQMKSMRRGPLCKNALSSWLLFRTFRSRSFLCPLLMKYTLASGKQALPSISASGIKRRISFGISVGIGFVRVSFIYFPLPAGKRHNRVIGYNRSWRRRNKGARREELPSGRGKAVLLAAFGQGRDVRSARRRAGEGLFQSAAVRRERLSLAPAARNVRAAVCFLGRSLPVRQAPPRRGVGAYRSLRFCRSVLQAAFLLPDCRRRGNDSFSKLS